MDFMNRGNRPVQQNTNGQPTDAGFSNVTQPLHPQETVKQDSGKPGKKAPKDRSKLVRIGQFAFLLAIVILVVAILISIAVGGEKKSPTTKEADKVKTGQLQAVFLNGGQVYFGKITGINSTNLTLDNIYYLRVNQQVQPGQTNNANDISLVKLGCELHGPEDSMVINRDQIVFWENLKTDGQVAKAVQEYVKANPDGQKCQQEQTGANTNSGSNTNNSGTANTNSNTNTNTNNRSNP